MASIAQALPLRQPPPPLPGAADLDTLEACELLDHIPFDPTVKRTESTIKNAEGRTFKVTKGAPHVIMKLVANREEIEKAVELKVGCVGVSCAHCAVLQPPPPTLPHDPRMTSATT